MTENDNQDRKLWVFGTVPEPVGGIAIFLQRLIESRQVPLGGLIDPYFGAKKTSLAIPHWHPAKRGALHRILTLMRLFRLRDQQLFINGSRPESILALSPFLFFRSAKKLLLLHHGDLWRSIENSGIRSALVKYTLRGYNTIFCLSEKQRLFYISNGVEDSRLILINSYIGVPENGLRHQMGDNISYSGGEPFSKQGREAIAWISNARSKVIIGSGYAQPFYNHEWVLDFLQQQRDAALRDARYILCCYGPETDYLKTLREQFTASNVKLCFGLSPVEFDAVLARSDIYVRPTSVDSFGIAIHDAQALGLKVIASDACERPNGVLVHETDNIDQFGQLLTGCLTSSDSNEDGPTNGDDHIAKRMTIIDALNQFCGIQALGTLQDGPNLDFSNLEVDCDPRL